MIWYSDVKLTFKNELDVTIRNILSLKMIEMWTTSLSEFIRRILYVLGKYLRSKLQFGGQVNFLDLKYEKK